MKGKEIDLLYWFNPLIYFDLESGENTTLGQMT